MRISDWSSDVCSSDLVSVAADEAPRRAREHGMQVMSSRVAGDRREVENDAPIAYRQRQKRLQPRSEEHTSELQSLMRISYAVFCLKKTKTQLTSTTSRHIISQMLKLNNRKDQL